MNFNPFTKLPKFMKSFYFIFGTFFLVWMLAVDSNDIFTQIKVTQKLNGLKAQKAYYQEKKVEVLKDREELNTNKKLLEKFARENYLMKKPSEDLYVVVTDD